MFKTPFHVLPWLFWLEVWKKTVAQPSASGDLFDRNFFISACNEPPDQCSRLGTYEKK